MAPPPPPGVAGLTGTAGPPRKGEGELAGTAADLETFERFRSYNWSADTAFLRGLAGMHARWQQEEPGITDELVAQRTDEAKVFYFQRYVAPLDLERYRQWETEETMRALHVLYQKFQAYNFDADASFQAGLPFLIDDLVRRNYRGHDLDREVQRSKMFYFSKRFGPVDWSAYELWAKVGGHQRANANGPLTCPFAPSGRGAVTAAPTDAAKAPHGPLPSVAVACPYAPSRDVAGGTAAPAADSTADRIVATRTPTGLTKLVLELADPERCMDPRMVHALGNILLDCVTNPAVTAVLWTITVSADAAGRYGPKAPLPLELWSLRHGAAVPHEALEAELRLLTTMARVVARVPVVVLLDAPLAGLAVPLALMAPLRIVTERAEVRLAGSSLVGISLGPLGHLPLHAVRYLAFATPAAYGADLVAAGAVTHFILSSQRATVEGKIAGAAACPPPHTGRALRKTLDDLTVHPGPSRLAVFKPLVAELFEDATSPAHLVDRLVGRATTPWSTNVVAVLRANAGPTQELAWANLANDRQRPLADAAADLYRKAGSGHDLGTDWATSGAPFPRLDVLAPDPLAAPVASWWRRE